MRKNLKYPCVQINARNASLTATSNLRDLLQIAYVYQKGSGTNWITIMIYVR